jgi:hypothetical protein
MGKEYHIGFANKKTGEPLRPSYILRVEKKNQRKFQADGHGKAVNSK